MITRRRFATTIGAASVLLGVLPKTLLANCSMCPRPDPSNFRPGDLLWPKSPQRLIPYNGTADIIQSDENRWLAQRNKLIVELEATASLSANDADILEKLKHTTYQNFESAYFEGSIPGELSPHGHTAADPREYVGHIAIIDRDTRGIAWVVEAVGTGVHRVSYNEWLKNRACESIWHGRIDPLSEAQRSAFVVEASQHQGKPYSLFDSIASFRLNDTKSFYCSKLVWHSVIATSGLALDDNYSASRFWPVSPRHLIESRHVSIVNGCGNYRDPQK